MRLVFDIQHPAFVHFFRPLILRLRDEGHEILVLGRDKDITMDLIRDLGVPYDTTSRLGHGVFGLGRELCTRIFKTLRVTRRFRPHVILSVTGVASGVVGAALRIPTIMLDEADHAFLQRTIALPFASRVMTGSGYEKNLGKKQLRFKGVWVQSYVGPRHFTPARQKVEQYGVDTSKPYFVVRLVSWHAAHDFGHGGASLESVERAVTGLSQWGRVLISSERTLPPTLSEYANPVSVSDMHHLLAFSRLYLGESTTMASEAAVMGTPSIYFGNLRWGYLRELADNYELVRIVNTLKEASYEAEGILGNDDTVATWRARASQLNAESDDIVERMYQEVNAASGGVVT